MSKFLIGLLAILGAAGASAADAPAPAPAKETPGAKPRAEARPHQASGAERGAQPRMKARQHFDKIDRDGSGSISPEEAKGHPHLEKDFAAMDDNHDGQVSGAEYGAYLKSHMSQSRDKAKDKAKARWDKADANNDGALSPEEARHSPFVAEHFTEMDADKNGQVTAQELAAYVKSHHPCDEANPGKK